MKVNLFTSDLQVLFKLKGRELYEELEVLDQKFHENHSIRAGSLLTWYYLLGNYDNHENTRDWVKSLAYLKKMVILGEDKTLTRGSSHNSYILFLL